MQKPEFRFDFSELNITVSQVEEVIGYEKGENRLMVSELIKEVLGHAGKICEIRAEYVIIPGISVNDSSTSIRINNLNFNVGKIVLVQLQRSESVAVFLCTAGHRIGEMSRNKMHEKDFLKGYIYDIIGSEIVEAAADLLQEKLKVEAEKVGKKITNRFSPGYCGWNVSEQHKLFQLIPDNFCGITLTESALMIPIKSVSGLIGIGRNVKFRPYACSKCDDKNCLYRGRKEKMQNFE
jgi:hypothetical protein